MFQEYYGLAGSPFGLTPDDRFFFSSTGHSRALSHLIYGLSQREGFIVITGEVGTGKTTLMEHLWSQLDRSSYVVGRVVTTQVNPEDMLRLVAQSFGIQYSGADKATLLGRFAELLRDQALGGRRCLLVVDEVQSLPLPALEELRMLSNIGGQHPPLQMILLGQPQFRRILASPDLDQLRQRVLASYHLGPLSREETHAYIEHRLRTVRWTGRPGWKPAVSEMVHHYTRGVPRQINRLCTRVLLYGFLEASEEITPDMVEVTAQELDADLASTSSAAAVPSAEAGDLAHRVAVLEELFARREHVFRRLFDLFSSSGVHG